MDVFRVVKDNVTARQVAEAYLIKRRDGDSSGELPRWDDVSN